MGVVDGQYESVQQAAHGLLLVHPPQIGGTEPVGETGRRTVADGERDATAAGRQPAQVLPLPRTPEVLAEQQHMAAVIGEQLGLRPLPALDIHLVHARHLQAVGDPGGPRAMGSGIRHRDGGAKIPTDPHPAVNSCVDGDIAVTHSELSLVGNPGRAGGDATAFPPP